MGTADRRPGELCEMSCLTSESRKHIYSIVTHTIWINLHGRKYLKKAIELITEPIHVCLTRLNISCGGLMPITGYRNRLNSCCLYFMDFNVLLERRVIAFQGSSYERLITNESAKI